MHKQPGGGENGDPAQNRLQAPPPVWGQLCRGGWSWKGSRAPRIAAAPARGPARGDPRAGEAGAARSRSGAGPDGQRDARSERPAQRRPGGRRLWGPERPAAPRGRGRHSSPPLPTSPTPSDSPRLPSPRSGHPGPGSAGGPSGRGPSGLPGPPPRPHALPSARLTSRVQGLGRFQV